MWGAMIAACTHSKTTGEEFHSEAAGVAAVTAMNYLTYRMFSPTYAVGASAAATTHYALSFRFH
jgi:hypothetical protein